MWSRTPKLKGGGFQAGWLQEGGRVGGGGGGHGLALDWKPPIHIQLVPRLMARVWFEPGVVAYNLGTAVMLLSGRYSADIFPFKKCVLISLTKFL